MNDSSRIHRATTFAARILLLCAITLAAGAQNTPGGVSHESGGLNGSLSREDLERMGGVKQHNASEASQGSPEDRAKVRGQSEALVKTLDLPCEVSDATLVVSGTSRSASAGKALETRVYEVACSNGLGYLLEARGAETPVALSCFSAEAARLADSAKGKPAGFYCKLAQSRDVKAMAATLMAGAGVTCAVRELRWFGRSAATHTEYSELVCDDGKGFLLRTALPGSRADTTVLSCADGARQGIHCRLTDPGPLEAAVTLDTFRGELVKNGISCRLDQIREIGQEDVHKRYVVEYLCEKQHSGMVAFIPLAPNDNPFETIPCNVAISRGVMCALTAVN